MHSKFLRAILSIALFTVPSIAQSVREYPEPCMPFSIGSSGLPSTVLVPQGSDLWMVVFPGAGGVRNDAYSVSLTMKGTSECIATFTKIDNIFPRDLNFREPVRVHAELPVTVGKRIGKLWESTLRMTRYQEPKPEGDVILGLLHADQCIFGFEYRFYGQVSFLATGPALQIQTVGYELARYVQAPPPERGKIRARIESLLNGPPSNNPHSN